MSSPQLANLVAIGQLKTEPKDILEFDNLVRSAQVRLADAVKKSLSKESRFDLAYNAAHSLALAALRWQGYRSTNRYLVFQVLPQTAGVGPEVWRVLDKCHQRRNLAEYEGSFDIEDQLLVDLLACANALLIKVLMLKN
jgi:hypothetical protein